jgi:hypothetical protein
VLTFRPLLNRSIGHSIKFEITKPDLHIKSLEELDRAATKFFTSSHPGGGTWLEWFIRSPTSSRHTSRVHWSTLFGGPGNAPLNSFFENAFQFPLYSFIDNELKTGRNANSLAAGRPLLYTAAVSADLRLTRILFNHGADPNFCGDEIKVLTPWKHVLGLIHQEGPQFTRLVNGKSIQLSISLDLKADLVSIFLDHNADPRAIVNEKSVEKSIKMAFLHWNRERTDELLRKVAVSKKTFKDPKKSHSGMKTLLKKLGRPRSKNHLSAGASVQIRDEK